MEYNDTDLVYITHSGCGEIAVIFSSVSLEGRHIFGACVLLEVECDVETACFRQSFWLWNNLRTINHLKTLMAGEHFLTIQRRSSNYKMEGTWNELAAT